MEKAKIISLKEKKKDQEFEEINMTPEQRILLTFELMDLAIAISPSKKLTSYDEGSIAWIELKECR